MWLFCYFNFERNYDVLKSKTPCILLNKNINYNKSETESKMENPTPEMNLVLQIIYESQIKGKTVMSWSTRNKKLFLTFEFYHNVQCIEYISRRYINNITSYTFCLFLKSSNTFSVSLNLKIAAQY